MKWGITLDRMIGYIPGTYDLFHVGHLRYLQNAKSMCDVLIVGVLTDELIEKYKGRKPSIPLSQRMEIVRALKCTDAVVEANTRNVFEEWKKLKFNMVFIGDDWFGDQQWREWESLLGQSGVKVYYLPRNTLISTTKIRESIRHLL